MSALSSWCVLILIIAGSIIAAVLVKEFSDWSRGPL